MSTNPTSIDLLRHGELLTPNLFCADPNEKLSEKGYQQLVSATEGAQWDVIVSSPFVRCREFAETLSQMQSCPLIVIDHFKEMDFGRWIGIEQNTIWKQDSKLLKLLWDSPKMFVAPGGESMTVFIDRVRRGWKEMLSTYQGQSILLITHAGVIRCILAEALNISYKSTLAFEIRHARYSRLHAYPDQAYSLLEHGASHCSTRINRDPNVI